MIMHYFFFSFLMILHYSLPILKNNDNALSLFLFSNAQGLVPILYFLVGSHLCYLVFIHLSYSLYLYQGITVRIWSKAVKSY